MKISAVERERYICDTGRNIGILCLNHPIGDVPLCGVEVDTDLRDGLAAECEPLAVVLEVDLLHCGLCVLVDLQFDDVEVGLGEHPPFCAYMPSM